MFIESQAWLEYPWIFPNHRFTFVISQGKGLNQVIDDRFGTVKAGAEGFSQFHVVERVTVEAKATIHHFNFNVVGVFGQNQFHTQSLYY